MAIMRPPKGMRPIDTNGWDAVSAVRINEVNEAIAAAGTSPKTWAAETGPGMEASGKFGDWAIGPGGDGHLINLVIPVRDVSVTFGEKVHTVPQAMVKVRVRLALLPSGRPQPESAGAEMTEMLLVLQTDVGPELAELEGPALKIATVLQIDGDEDLPIIAQAILTTALDTWLNSNLSAFHHVFATVNVAKISEEDSSGGLDWLRLTSVSYAFGHNAATPDNGVLAILGQTEGRSSDGLINQAQAEIIPNDMDAAICISRSRFLRNMIVPGLPVAFKGLSVKNIKIKKRDTGLFVEKPVQLESVKHEGDTFDPIMERFDISLRDTDLKMESQTRTEVSPGIFSMNSTVATYAFGMSENKHGEKTMQFEEVEKPTSRDWTEKTSAVKIIQTIVGILAGVAAVVAIVATAGTATFAAAIVVGVLAGLSSATIGLIEKIKGDDGPPLTMLMTAATSSVTWSTGTRFDPHFMAMNGGLQIGGVFAESRAPTESMGGISEREHFQKQFQDQFSNIMQERAKL